MGFFSRRKEEKEKSYENMRDFTKADISLRYSSGINADITFGDEIVLGEEYQNKHIQSVRAVYTKPNGEFISNEYLIEPLYGTDGSGSKQNMTAQYYKSLLEQGRLNDVKGFFKEEFASDLEKTNGNYLGSLSYDEFGNAFRYYDEGFRQNYAKSWNREKQLKNKEKSNLNIRKELKEQTTTINEGYQSWLNNEDARARGDYDLSAKDNVR